MNQTNEKGDRREEKEWKSEREREKERRKEGEEREEKEEFPLSSRPWKAGAGPGYSCSYSCSPS